VARKQASPSEPLLLADAEEAVAVGEEVVGAVKGGQVGTGPETACAEERAGRDVVQESGGATAEDLTERVV
jgi:hypothetical protein